ncbi:FGGY-family carbohydrate kinase [Cellulomonas endophytica]|uniref:FGGY-family carbohydrate kinase n=1 Tax=Cellulomonas endophytica TaxID=2494735 RepID=UPI0010102DE7|nr:FGGY family carbohydrate kinase [Cellulomonas endophytica]
MGQLVAGLDLGSTGVKVLVADEDGTEVLVRQRPTPWVAGPGGTTDLRAADLMAVVRDLLDDVDVALPAVAGDREPRIRALAVSGMGETGFLLDAAGEALAPGLAWFDPRGAEQVDALPAELRAEFPGRTGLPWGVQVTVAKILHLRSEGVPLAGARWANLPEHVAHALGGRLVSELSLASRTGLLDQDTGAPWRAMLDHLGVDEGFLPEPVAAGTDLGEAAPGAVPASVVGARLTVAGHDHLVSAVAGGLDAADRYHVSMGTAEVLLRVVDEPLTFAARARLGEALINCVRHVVPGQHVLVAGVKTGLLMRRVLQLVGVHDATGRDRLDDEVQALGGRSRLEPGGLEVAGARNDDGVLRLTVRSDGVSPAETFLAVLRHGNDEIRRLVDVMDREIPPARTTLLAGGWASMASVRQERAAVLPGLEVSPRTQDTAHGAALFAARLLPAALAGTDR